MLSLITSSIFADFNVKSHADVMVKTVFNLVDKFEFVFMRGLLQFFKWNLKYYISKCRKVLLYIKIQSFLFF